MTRFRNTSAISLIADCRTRLNDTMQRPAARIHRVFLEIRVLALTLTLGLLLATAGHAEAADETSHGSGSVPAAYDAILSSLFDALASEEPAVRAVALETTRSLLSSLKESGDPGALAAIRTALREAPSPAVQAQAGFVLGTLEDSESLPDLRAAMTRGDRELRFTAAHALRKLGDEISMEFVNHYERVDWETSGHHDANLHTHTNLSDGRYDPHYAIDQYHDLNYEILALTDHDSMHVDVFPRALYPWTDLNAIYHEIKDKRSVRYDRSYEEVADEEWQNRDPEALGMVSIEGSEISRTHHISSLFNEYAGGTDSEEIAFQEIARRSGLAVFNHPGRYQRGVEWYVEYFRRYKHVVGMEVYNQIDRYPVDRKRWDNILYHLMPERPVWGLANDDTHTDAHFGRNRNIFVLAELTQDAVFQAVKNGHFYFFVPVEQGTRPPVRLTGVKVGGDLIHLDLEGDYERIEWITYNPFTDESELLAEGSQFLLDALSMPSPFVRAVIVSDAGRTYTQPFGIRLRVEKTSVVDSRHVVKSEHVFLTSSRGLAPDGIATRAADSGLRFNVEP